MAGEATRYFPGDEPDESNPAGFISDGIDTMVSSFLENLTDISSETKQVCQPDDDGDSEILPVAEPARIYQILPSNEAMRAESDLIFGEIRDEVEEALIQLEHQNSQTISAADQSESIEKPSSFFPPEEEQVLSEFPSPPAAEPDAPQSVAESPPPAPVDSENEEMWKFLEVFRNTNTHSHLSFFQRQKHLIITSAAVALILVLGGVYFLWSQRITPVSETFGQIHNLNRQHVQNPEKQIPGALPFLDNSGTALAGEVRDAGMAPATNEIRLSQKTDPTSTLVEENPEEHINPASAKGIY